jgi:hypothetical protein
VRPLIIDDVAKARAAKLRAYAEQPEHHYTPYVDAVPGDQPEFQLQLNTYKCVFTITKSPRDGSLVRHLSISIPAAGSYANPVAVFAIADLLGFTGWDGADKAGKDWTVGMHETERCIVVAQSYEARRV